MAVLISYDGYTFADDDYAGDLPVDDARGAWRIDPIILPRPGGGPLIAGGLISERRFVCEFTWQGSALAVYDAVDQLLGKLDPTNATPRSIIVERFDATRIENQALVTLPAEFDIGRSLDVLRVEFVLANPIWRAVDWSAFAEPAVIVEAETPIPATIDGQAKVYPIYALRPTAQRATFAEDHGWTWTRAVTITNNDTSDMVNETITVDLGDTTGWDALTNGDDVRVRLGDEELPRTLTNFNTKRSLLRFVANAPAGDMTTYLVIHGNPAATAPPTLGDFAAAGDDPTRYSALDLGGTNGTATSGGASTLTQSGAGWTVDRWAGCTIQLVDGTGAGQRRRVLSNTADTVTTTRAWSTQPDNTSVFVIWSSGILGDGGAVSTNGTSTTTTDSSQAWGVNSWKGATLVNVTRGTTATVTSNTATTLTHGGVAAAQSGDVYYLERQGCLRYYVDQVNHAENWRGGWHQTARYTRPGKTQFGELGVANAWNRVTRWPNRDRYSQKRTTPVVVGGPTHYFPILDVNRGVGGGARYVEQGSGDGVEYTCWTGLIAAYFDYAIKNPNGICRAVISVKEEGGEDYADVVTYTTAQASLTPIAGQWVDLTTYGAPVHLYMGLGPADDVEIPLTAGKTDTATMRWENRLELLIDVSTWSISALGAPVEVYDCQGRLATVPLPMIGPFDEIVFNALVPLNQQLVVRTDPDTTETRVAIGGHGAPWAARFIRHEEWGDDVAREFAPLHPGERTLTYYESDIGELELDVSWRAGYWLH